MTSRRTPSVGDWSYFFNEECCPTLPRTIPHADPSEQVCDCEEHHHKVADDDDATIEKLCEEFQATLQTRVADVIKQVCEEFKATFPYMHSQDRKDPLLVVTGCSDTESEDSFFSHEDASPLHHNREQDHHHPCGPIEIPEFVGASSSAEAFLDWLATVEEVLDFKKVPEEHRVSLVAPSFRGQAASWWDRFELQRYLYGKEKIVSWEKLKKHMKRVFVPDKYNRFLLQKFNNIRQGSRTLDEYATEFFKLTSRIYDIDDSDRQLTARFIAGLEPRLQRMLKPFRLLTVSEAYQRAVVMEQQTRGGSSTCTYYAKH